MKIRAAVTPGPGAPFPMEELELETPRTDEVLYGSCGRCANCLRARPWACLEFWERNFGATRSDGESVPDVFVPRLLDLWRAGRFPVERIMSSYDFDQIQNAAEDAEQGVVVKPVLRMPM